MSRDPSHALSISPPPLKTHISMNPKPFSSRRPSTSSNKSNQESVEHKLATSPHRNNPLMAKMAQKSAEQAFEASRFKILKLGHYRLGKTLGVGSFGKVKLAIHQITGHKVAVKILNRAKLAKSSSLSRSREIQILKLLWHPNIIRLYDVIETPTDIFLIMEYVSGGELFEFIVQHGRSTEESSRKMFQQIVFAIDYCHRLNVVHRDLKPENLLIDAEGNIKLADFGLSNIMRDGEFLSSSCGSPNYAAPEVISGKPYAGPEVDVWSLGVILYALMAGRLPFDDDYIPALFRKIRSGKYTMPSFFSSGAKDLIASLLVVDPLQRIPLENVLEHPWFLENAPVHLQRYRMRPGGRSLDVSEIDFRVLSSVISKFSQADERLLSPTPTKKKYKHKKTPSNTQFQSIVANQVINAPPEIIDNPLFQKAVLDLVSGTMNSVTVAYHLTRDAESASLSNNGPSASLSFNNIGNDPLSPRRSTSPLSFGSTTSPISSSPPLSSPLLDSFPNRRDSLSSRSKSPTFEYEAGIPLSYPVPTIQDPVTLEWNLGKRFNTKPQVIMTSIFTVLIHLGIQWKIISTYEIRCLSETVKIKPHLSPHDSKPNSNQISPSFDNNISIPDNYSNSLSIKTSATSLPTQISSSDMSNSDIKGNIQDAPFVTTIMTDNSTIETLKFGIKIYSFQPSFVVDIRFLQGNMVGFLYQASHIISLITSLLSA